MIAQNDDRLLGFELEGPPFGAARMYAISFDLLLEKLRENYSRTAPQNAYAEIRTILESEGFLWQQGSVYFGKPGSVDAIRCVLAAQRLAKQLPWFSACVRDIRMLRIEENNNLLPAISP